MKYEIKGEPPPTERILVVFGIGGACPVFVSGPVVKNEVSEATVEFYQQVSQDGLTTCDPDHGVWVWEGIPVAVYSSSFESGVEFDYYDYDQGTWREPTKEEWNAFQKNENPWSVKPEEEKKCSKCSIKLSVLEAPGLPSAVMGHVVGDGELLCMDCAPNDPRFQRKWFGKNEEEQKNKGEK